MTTAKPAVGDYRAVFDSLRAVGAIETVEFQADPGPPKPMVRGHFHITYRRPEKPMTPKELAADERAAAKRLARQARRHQGRILLAWTFRWASPIHSKFINKFPVLSCI